MLDVKDKKILYELDSNSRTGFACLAKRVGLSQETVRYRVNRLLKDQVIWKFLTVLNLSALGFTMYKVLVKLQNTTTEKRQEIIEHLCSEKDVAWVGSIDGDYNLGFLVMAKNVFRLGEVLSEFNNRFSTYVLKKAICANLSGEYYQRDYLLCRKRRIEENYPAYSLKTPMCELDSHDFKILSSIAGNARASACEIAQMAGLSADSVARRLKKMEKSKVIVSYQVLLHNEKIGQIRYKILLYTHSITQEKENSIFAFCRMHPNIIYVIKTVGPWELEIDVEVSTAEEFRDILMQLTSKFADVLRDYSALMIYDIHKYYMMPPVY